MLCCVQHTLDIFAMNINKNSGHTAEQFYFRGADGSQEQVGLKHPLRFFSSIEQVTSSKIVCN